MFSRCLLSFELLAIFKHQGTTCDDRRWVIARLKSDLTIDVTRDEKTKKMCSPLGVGGPRNGYRCFSGIICVLCRQFLAPRPCFGCRFSRFFTQNHPWPIVRTTRFFFFPSFFQKRVIRHEGWTQALLLLSLLWSRLATGRYTPRLDNKPDLTPLRAKFNTNLGEISRSVHGRF